MVTIERLENWSFGILRGAVEDTGFAAWVIQTLGVSLPAHPNTSTRNESVFLWWLAPDAWLVQYDAVNMYAEPAELNAQAQAAGGAWVNVSDAYQGLTLRGAAAAELINRGCPLDLHAGVFPAGSVARSVCFDVPVWLQRLDDQHWIVLSTRSMFGHLSHMLAQANVSAC